MGRISETSSGKVGPALPGAWRAAAKMWNLPWRKGRAADERGTHETFIARIKASPNSISSTRWRYQWEEVFLKDDLSVATFTAARRSRLDAGAGYLDSYAINLCELCQVAATPTVLGPGIVLSHIPAGFSLQPIAENTCVIMHVFNRVSGKIQYAFSMPNAIDGACA